MDSAREGCSGVLPRHQIEFSSGALYVLREIKAKNCAA